MDALAITIVVVTTVVPFVAMALVRRWMKRQPPAPGLDAPPPGGDGTGSGR